jgi:ubiquinone/menaquinone biosynthesis C-methylase UbiE
MATGLQFDDEGSRLVEAINMTPGIVARRRAMLHALALSPGERVLEVGSGPGHLALEMASAVGLAGRIDGLDNSAHMLAMAQRRCADQPAVAFHLGDATRLPFPANHFDAAVSSQVFAYLSDVPTALAELYRVLHPGGRVLIQDTDWDSIVWYSTDRARMQRILAAACQHLVDPYLPQTLAAKLKQAGFLLHHQDIIPQFNPEYGSNTFSHWLIELIVAFVGGQDGITREEAEAWAADLRKLGEDGAYFFSLNEYLFLACKPEARDIV